MQGVYTPTFPNSFHLDLYLVSALHTSNTFYTMLQQLAMPNTVCPLHQVLRIAMYVSRWSLENIFCHNVGKMPDTDEISPQCPMPGVPTEGKITDLCITLRRSPL